MIFGGKGPEEVLLGDYIGTIFYKEGWKFKISGTSLFYALVHLFARKS